MAVISQETLAAFAKCPFYVIFLGLMINATQIRKGNVIIFDGVPHRVLSFEHRSPGKGAAFVRVLLRNLETGASYDNRYASNDSVEKATLEQKEMEYLYKDGELFAFMDTENYEQISLNSELLGDYEKFLKEGQVLEIQFFGEKPIGLEPPTTIILEVTETEPELKGATASNSPKPATLETGAVVQVPPFVKIGDKVRITTADGKYQERA